MKKFGFKFFTLLAMLATVSFGVTSCGGDDGGNSNEFNENEYAGIYYGKHIVNDPTLNAIIKQLDPENTDGSFNDTITVSPGADPNDKIMEFTSALLNNETIQANFSKTNQNVIEKEFGTLVLGDSVVVTIENAKVKSTSQITPSGGNTFQATLRLAGKLKAGAIDFDIPNLETRGTFKK